MAGLHALEVMGGCTHMYASLVKTVRVSVHVRSLLVPSVTVANRHAIDYNFRLRTHDVFSLSEEKSVQFPPITSWLSEGDSTRC